MRGAGCTINDMWDQDYDKKVDLSWKGTERLLSVLQCRPVASLLHHIKQQDRFMSSLKSSMRRAGIS